MTFYLSPTEKKRFVDYAKRHRKSQSNIVATALLKALEGAEDD